MAAIGLHDRGAALVIDEMREGKGAAEIGGIGGALVARSEEPELGNAVARRHGVDAGERMIGRQRIGEERHELANLRRKMLDAERPGAVLQGAGGALVAPPGPPDAAIDAPGIKRL